MSAMLPNHLSYQMTDAASDYPDESNEGDNTNVDDNRGRTPRFTGDAHKATRKCWWKMEV
jgi:hypothetical protein